MEEEIWKTIEHTDYEISNLGNIKHGNKQPALNTTSNVTQLIVTLTTNGISTKRALHRLVAEVFIPNPNNLPYAVKIDKDQNNNRADNIAWSSSRTSIRG